MTMTKDIKEKKIFLADTQEEDFYFKSENIINKGFSIKNIII